MQNIKSKLNKIALILMEQLRISDLKKKRKAAFPLSVSVKQTVCRRKVEKCISFERHTVWWFNRSPDICEYLK